MLDLHQPEMLSRFYEHAQKELREFQTVDSRKSIHFSLETFSKLNPVRSSVQLQPVKSSLQLNPPLSVPKSEQKMWSELRIVPLKVKNINIESAVLQQSTMKLLKKRITNSISKETPNL